VKDNNYGGCGEEAGIHLKQRDLVKLHMMFKIILDTCNVVDSGIPIWPPKRILKK